MSQNDIWRGSGIIFYIGLYLPVIHTGVCSNLRLDLSGDGTEIQVAISLIALHTDNRENAGGEAL
jgi:hypothetical protein